MTTGLREGLGVHAQALVLRGQRNNLLASNIANASVPGFKARDFDFETELARQTQLGASLRTSSSEHVSMAGAGASGQNAYRVPVMPSMDGNTVDMALEQMEFAENTVRYQTSLELLNRRISGLMTVIRGE
jgi:flagellar basal-body rod protein FlgB